MDPSYSGVISATPLVLNLSPVTPVGPVGPVLPVSPVGPVRPVVPVGPVNPAPSNFTAYAYVL
jgi:hypothetical protein